MGERPLPNGPLPGERLLSGSQALYYFSTAVWPFFSRASYERVIGRKHDFCLVRTVGLLLAAARTSLLVGLSSRGLLLGWPVALVRRVGWG